MIAGLEQMVGIRGHFVRMSPSVHRVFYRTEPIQIETRATLSLCLLIRPTHQLPLRAFCSNRDGTANLELVGAIQEIANHFCVPRLLFESLYGA